jgi:hypothetical protein
MCWKIVIGSDSLVYEAGQHHMQRPYVLHVLDMVSLV